ncbi:MAG TPA: lipopolysaccharide assembly protein LapA domain-containing protein [Stellaceae bacterium]
MRVLFWVLVLLVAVVLASFAVSNREPVALGLWPLPWLLQTPVYLAAFAALLLGFVAGALAVWAGGARRRRELRRHRRRIAALERELAATQAQLTGAPGATPVRIAAEG